MQAREESLGESTRTKAMVVVNVCKFGQRCAEQLANGTVSGLAKDCSDGESFARELGKLLTGSRDRQAKRVELVRGEEQRIASRGNSR